MLSTALSVAVFGVREWPLLLPNVICLAIVASGLRWVLFRWVGVLSASIATAVLVTTPIAIETVTTLMPDLLEALLVFS